MPNESEPSNSAPEPFSSMLCDQIRECRAPDSNDWGVLQVKDAGGLLVLVLSMQESERVANQLRGRAGRQGDPGETFTLVDLNDPLVEAAGLSSGMEAARPFLQSARRYSCLPELSSSDPQNCLPKMQWSSFPACRPCALPAECRFLGTPCLPQHSCFGLVSYLALRSLWCSTV